MAKPKDQKKHKPNPKKPQAKNAGNDRWKYFLALAAILLISFIAYYPSLDNGFVWDDDDYIKNNAVIQSINLKDIFSEFVMGNYHPLTMFVMAIEWKMFGLETYGYHLVNILFHLLNTLLVYRAVSLLSGKQAIGLVAALLFGIHPLHVESVTWISELKDLMYTFFFLLAFISYIRYIDSNTKKYFYYSMLFFLLSLLSKAMGASFPFVLLLTDYFRGRKFTTKVIMEKAPFFVMAVILGIVAIFAQKATGATDIAVFPFPQRIVFACYGFIAYIAKLAVPLNLCAYYDYPIKPGGDIPGMYFVFILLVIALVAAVFYSLRYSKKTFFAFGFFSVTVFLVLQLLPVGGAIMADRYSYVPSIGIFYLFGEFIYWLWNKGKSSTFRVPAMAIIAVAIVFYSSTTYARCDVWKDGMTLWNNVIDQYKTIPQAYINRGVIYANEGRDDLAMIDYNKAIQIESKIDKAYNNRGILLARLKKYDEALRDYNKALQLNPKYSSAYNNRGVLYKIQNDLPTAIENYNNAIKYKPTYIDAYYNRGVAYRNMNKYPEAMRDFDKVIQLNPNYANVYSARAILYVNQNNYKQAFEEYATAIRIQPTLAIAYSNRANLHKTLNHTQEAINDYSKAIELQPKVADPYYWRGLLYMDSGNKQGGCNDLQQASALGLGQAADEFNRRCK